MSQRLAPLSASTDTSPLALINGKVWTADPDKPGAAAMLVRNGIVDAVGETDEILHRASHDAQVCGPSVRQGPHRHRCQ